MSNPMPISAAPNPVPVAPAPTGSTEQQVLQLGHALGILVANYNALLAQFKVLQKNTGKQPVIFGTPHEIIVTSGGGNVTLSTPQAIDILSQVQFGAEIIQPISDGVCFTVENDANVPIFQVNTASQITSARFLALQPSVDDPTLVVKNAAASIDVLNVDTNTGVTTAISVALANGGGGNFYSANGNGGQSGSFASGGVIYENGLLITGDPTGGGGGAGIPDVTGATPHTLNVRESGNSGVGTGNWTPLTTFFDGIAPATLGPRDFAHHAGHDRHGRLGSNGHSDHLRRHGARDHESRRW